MPAVSPADAEAIERNMKLLSKMSESQKRQWLKECERQVPQAITALQWRVDDTKLWTPQPGPQTQFVEATEPDIVIFGGAAGGGKSASLILYPALNRHIENPGYRAVYFRRLSPMITDAGAIWDETRKLYPKIGGVGVGKENWSFPSGAQISFSHLAEENTVESYQSSQLAGMFFDEITQFCMKPSHEVLTADGWRAIGDVVIGDLVASLSPDGDIEYEPVTDTQVFPYDGDMIRVYQRSGVSFDVTPNHRVPVISQSDKGGWRFVTAEHFQSTIQSVPRIGRWAGVEQMEPVRLHKPSGRGHGRNANNADAIPLDDYLELLGWFLAKGCAFTGSQSPRICIRQTKQSDSLRALMGRLPYRVMHDSDGGYHIFSRQLFEHFKPLGDTYMKRVPRWIFRLSRRQLRILFEAFTAGDGSRSKHCGHIQFGLANEGLADDLQEIAFLLGLVAYRGYYVARGKYRVFTVGISGPKRHETMIKPRSVRREHYAGRVHCITVARNHTFLTRLDGRTSWTGNSESQFWFMTSRNRSVCGIKPYIRAACNPEPGWVKNLLAPWVDIHYSGEKAEPGEVRHFIRENEKLKWVGDDYTVQPLEGADPVKPTSITFIPSRLTDNQELMKADPGYVARLYALPEPFRSRFLYGDWSVSEGSYFDDFRRDLHVVPPDWFPHNLPVKGQFQPPQWYTFFGGLDWGYSAPFSFVLGCMDEEKHVRILETVEKAHLSDGEQASEVCAMLRRWGVPPDRCRIMADSSMWSQMRDGVQVTPHIRAYKKAGLRCYEAPNSTKEAVARMSVIRLWFRSRRFKIFDGFNDPLVTAIENVKYGKGSRAEYFSHEGDSEKYTHSVYALGCAMAAQARPAQSPLVEMGIEEQKVLAQQEYDETTRELQRYDLEQRNAALGYYLPGEQPKKPTAASPLGW